jgi:hypothetical protein
MFSLSVATALFCIHDQLFVDKISVLQQIVMPRNAPCYTVQRNNYKTYQATKHAKLQTHRATEHNKYRNKILRGTHLLQGVFYNNFQLLDKTF